MLVFVDDAVGTGQVESVKGPLSRRLSQLLKDRGVVTETVSYERLLQLMATEGAFERMPVAQVGQRLGAGTVLYVSVDRFALEQYAGQLWQGRLETTVRVVDVQEGRLWPKDQPRGYPVGQVEIPASEAPGADYESTLARRLADMMAERSRTGDDDLGRMSPPGRGGGYPKR